MGAVYAYTILLTFLGPEYRGRHLGVAHDHDMEEAAGTDAVAKVTHGEARNGSGSEDEAIAHA